MEFINITFRDTFAKQFVTDDNRQTITAAVMRFCSLPEQDAIDILWRMSYTNSGIDKILSKMGLNFPVEKVKVLIEELLYQKKQVNPHFLNVAVPCKCLDAFNALAERNQIVAKVVLDKCQIAFYSTTNDFRFTLDLLKDDNENRHFAGLRNLNFSYREADFLKQFHKEIYELATICYEQYKEHTCLADSATSPFANLRKLVDDSGLKLADEMPIVEPNASATIVPVAPTKFEPEVSFKARTNSKFVSLTAEAVLKYPDIFAAFAESSDMNALVELGKIGFDLNEIMSKKEKIKNFLKATKALTE